MGACITLPSYHHFPNLHVNGSFSISFRKLSIFQFSFPFFLFLFLKLFPCNYMTIILLPSFYNVEAASLFSPIRSVSGWDAVEIFQRAIFTSDSINYAVNLKLYAEGKGHCWSFSGDILLWNIVRAAKQLPLPKWETLLPSLAYVFVCLKNV